jgi:beta-lactamase regulating signal transducer with metallopeptidase domain
VFVGLLALSVCTPLITWGLQPKVISSLAATQDLGVLTSEFSTSPMTLPDHEFSLERGANPFVGSGDPAYPGDSAPAPVVFEAGASSELPTPPVALPSASWSEQLRALLQSWLPRIVAGWMIGVAFCALRPLLGWHTLWRLRHVGVSPVSNDLVAATNRIASRLGLHYAVRVLQPTLAQVPVVVGYLRPVILLPVNLMSNIPVEQLESILAHELAHVRRHDFVVNLLQTLVETFFFYHPAIWWISHLIRVEREHCCDDLVIKLLDNRVEYGRALLAIEELRGSARRTLLAPGATDGSLICRVRRIVGLNSDRTVNSPWSVLCLVGCCVSAVCTLSILSKFGGRFTVTTDH